MPHLTESKIKLLEKMTNGRDSQSAQDIQDDIFRKMSAERKVKLASDFFGFARTLNKRGLSYGTRRVIERDRRDS